MRLLTPVIAALLLAPLCSCSKPTAETSDGKVSAYAAVPPIAYLVERVGGDNVKVGVLVSAGQDPHSFQLSAKQVYSLGLSQAYFGAGMPFEEAIAHDVAANSPDLRILNLADTGEHEDHAHHDETEDHDAADHHDEDGDDHAEHGHEGHGHHHHGPDPHFWLSPVGAIAAARTIADTLIEIDPSHAPHYKNNLQTLIAGLETVNIELQAQLAPFKGQRFYVYHPAFGHFGKTYGLEQVAVEFEGKEPSIKQVDALIESARADNIRVLFVQPQFSPEAAKTIAEAIGGVVVSVDPLRKDLITNLRGLADELRDAFATNAAGEVQ